MLAYNYAWDKCCSIRRTDKRPRSGRSTMHAILAQSPTQQQSCGTCRLWDCQSTMRAAAVGCASAESACSQGRSSRPARSDCPCCREKLRSSEGPEMPGICACCPAAMGRLGRWVPGWARSCASSAAGCWYRRSPAQSCVLIPEGQLLGRA